MNDENVEIVEKEVSTRSKEVNDDDVPNSNELPKDPKYTSPKPFTPLYHSLKGWLRLNMIYNLGTFRSP